MTDDEMKRHIYSDSEFDYYHAAGEQIEKIFELSESMQYDPETAEVDSETKELKKQFSFLRMTKKAFETEYELTDIDIPRKKVGHTRINGIVRGARDLVGLPNAKKEKEHVVFVVAIERKTGELVGYLYGYNAVHANERKRESDDAIRDLLGPDNSYYVIKHILSEVDGRGVRRGLAASYWQFVKQFDENTEYIFSTIIAKPRNRVAIDFHKSIGFTQLLESISKRGPEDQYPNVIWYRSWYPNFFGEWADPSYSEGGKSSDLQLETPAEQKRNEIAILQINMNLASSLYKHEDDLNWKKISLCINIMRALLVGLWGINRGLIYNENNQFNIFTVLSSIFLLIIGYGIVGLTRKMIESGIQFMASHKRTTRILEARLRMISPLFAPVVWSAPVRSRTVATLEAIMRGSALIWTTITVFIIVVNVSYLLSGKRHSDDQRLYYEINQSSSFLKAHLHIAETGLVTVNPVMMAPALPNKSMAVLRFDGSII